MVWILTVILLVGEGTATLEMRTANQAECEKAALVAVDSLKTKGDAFAFCSREGRA